MMITLDIIGHFILLILFLTGLFFTINRQKQYLGLFWKIGAGGSLVNLVAQSYRNFIGSIPNFINNLEFMIFFIYLAFCFWYLWYEHAGPYTDDVDREYMANFALLGMTLMASILFIFTQSIWFSNGTIIIFAIYGTFSFLMTIKNRWLLEERIKGDKKLYFEFIAYIITTVGLLFLTSLLFSQTIFNIGQILLFLGFSSVIISKILVLIDQA